MSLLAILLGVAFVAQNPAELFEKAPPSVDEALRARVGKFYQAHVDGKFRLADQVVAEDSKDIFFAADKKRYRAFEIARINYSDNFTKARVVVAVDTDFATAGRSFPVKMPLTTLWKVIDGEWFWYTQPAKEIDSPFGKMKPGAEGAAPPPFPAKLDPAAILNQVSVDKTEVRLSSYEKAEAEIIVTNRAAGAVSLAVDYNGFPGLEIALDRKELKGGEVARLALRCNPKDKAPKPTVVANLRVEPFNRVIPIRITFAVPPEVEKSLPK